MTNKKMFSSYSWGDFFKVFVVVTFLYYAFVVWKYDRQNIMDWFGNRGKQPDEPTPATIDEEDDEEDDSFYGSIQVNIPSPAAVTVVAEPEPVVVHQEQPVVEIGQAPVLADLDDEDYSGLLQEERLDNLVEAANRTTRQAESGALVPADPQDQEAIRIADLINAQSGLPPELAGIKFKH